MIWENRNPGEDTESSRLETYILVYNWKDLACLRLYWDEGRTPALGDQSCGEFTPDSRTGFCLVICRGIVLRALITHFEDGAGLLGGVGI